MIRTTKCTIAVPEALDHERVLQLVEFTEKLAESGTDFHSAIFFTELKDFIFSKMYEDTTDSNDEKAVKQLLRENWEQHESEQP
jgi:hypothetical protein